MPEPPDFRKHQDEWHKHPEGALCAAGGFYPPLQSVREAGSFQQTALLDFLQIPAQLQNRAGEGFKTVQKNPPCHDMICTPNTGHPVLGVLQYEIQL